MGIFVLKEKEHERFIRKGADLYIKRDISLSEALCGYNMEVEHLDGRILVIKSNPGEIITPMTTDPLQKEAPGMQFETFDDCDCLAENVAQAETEDTDACKKVCEKKGFTAFVINDGSAIFKNCSRAEALAAKKPKAGSTLYVVEDQENVEVHYLTDLDPVASYKEGVDNHGKDAYDEDEERQSLPGGQRVQCNQQ